jgi:hypothetical protein
MPVNRQQEPYGELFRWSLSMNFAQALSKQLTSGALRPREQFTIVEGDLVLEEKISAHCKWIVGNDWKNLPPMVSCDEGWMKFGPKENDYALSEWHVMKGKTICYMLSEQWGDYLGKLVQSLSDIDLTLCAAAYASNNLRWILGHHLEGFRLDLEHWHKDWPQWDHREKGVKQYEKLRIQLIDEIIIEDK